MPVRTKPTILWVDDTPDEPGPGGGTLRAAIEAILSGEFELLHAIDKKQAVGMIKADRRCAIRLVLLDIQFKESGGIYLPENQGQSIAKELFDLREGMLPRSSPEGLLKFLVLTHLDVDGRTINLSNKGCKIEHLLKDELADEGKREYLRNLIRAIAKDFANRHLEIEWQPNNARLDMKATVEGQVIEKSIAIPPAHLDLLGRCLASPNISLPQGNSGKAGRAVSDVNEKIREATGGRVWGLLTRVNSGEVMGVIPRGNIKAGGCEAPIPGPSRLATALELERSEKELNKALADVRTQLAELVRWKKEMNVWKTELNKARGDSGKQLAELIRWQKEMIVIRQGKPNRRGNPK